MRGLMHRLGPGWALLGLTAFAGPAAQQAQAQAQDSKIAVVAAENFYADIASQIGGGHVAVTAIMSNPDEDPHLFEVNPSVGRALAGARVVVYNGADYDPWMPKLVAATEGSARQVIVAADLTGHKTGDNPHLWYDPATMPAVAKALAAAFEAADPSHKSDYEAGLAGFLDALKPVEAKEAAIRSRFAGVPVTATEPVFGYMAEALGLQMRNQRFQLAVMNEAEPSAADTAAFEDDLRHRKVRVFLYNSQATDSAAERLLKIARDSKVPVVGVSETEPKDKKFQEWMTSELDALDKALSTPAP